MLEDINSRNITIIEIDDDGHFLCFFMALGSCIRDFRHTIRPIITIDDTFFKGKFSLFVAVAHDGNNSIYLVAYGTLIQKMMHCGNGL